MRIPDRIAALVRLAAAVKTVFTLAGEGWAVCRFRDRHTA